MRPSAAKALTTREITERVGCLHAGELSAEQMCKVIDGLMLTPGEPSDRAVEEFILYLPEFHVTRLLARLVFGESPNGERYADSWHHLRAHALAHGWLHHDVAFYDHETGVHVQSLPREDVAIQREHRRALLIFRLLVEKRRSGR